MNRKLFAALTFFSLLASSASFASAFDDQDRHDLEQVRSELKRCLVRTQVVSPRTGRPIRSFVESHCEGIEVAGEFVRSEAFEVRMIPAKGPQGSLCDIVIWGERGSMLLEATQLPRGPSPLDPLVTALELGGELTQRTIPADRSAEAATTAELLQSR